MFRLCTTICSVLLLALTGIFAAADAGYSGRPVVMHPTVSDYQLITASTTPPTEAQCESVGRTCFTPQAIQAAYNLGPLYAQGRQGQGQTIAIIDAYGSDTMAHDL